MKLAPISFYLSNLVLHSLISIPFWFIAPKFNCLLLFTFIIISLFGSTKDGEHFFNSDDKNMYDE